MEGKVRTPLGRVLSLGLVAALVAFAMAPFLPLPARGCSCAIPSDIKGWVDESEAAFVGTLVDRHDGLEGQFGQESIYVFEVEEWVKGDAGDVIEVRSASNGAACGFEFWEEDTRIGAILREEAGELHGGLCSQIDPDVLLAAMEGPTKSSTGIGHLLVGGGWSSERSTVIDKSGGVVTHLLPPNGNEDGFGGGAFFDACPGGRMAIQLTPTGLTTWDLSHLELAEHVELDPNAAESIRAATCRNEDATSVWAVVQNGQSQTLVDMATLEELAMLQGQAPTWTFGEGFVVTQHEGEGDPILTDAASGEQVRLHETPPGENWAINVAPHPNEQLVALVETRFSAGERPVEATLFILDTEAEIVEQFEIPYETYSPVWLDENRIAVTAYNYEDWEESYGLIFDLENGTTDEIEGWTPEHQIADGHVLYGTMGADVMTADLTTGEVDTLVTLPLQSAGPLLLLDHGEPGTTTTTTTTSESAPAPNSTTPPLVAPDLGSDQADATHLPWLAGIAIVGFLGVLVWLAVRSPEASE